MPSEKPVCLSVTKLMSVPTTNPMPSFYSGTCFLKVLLESPDSTQKIFINFIASILVSLQPSHNIFIFIFTNAKQFSIEMGQTLRAHSEVLQSASIQYLAHTSGSPQRPVTHVPGNFLAFPIVCPIIYV